MGLIHRIMKWARRRDRERDRERKRVILKGKKLLAQKYG